MKKILMITVLFCCFFPLIAQESSPKKAKIFQAWIELNNNSAIAKGVLYEVSDSSIFLTDKPDTSGIREYNFRNIDLLKVRRTKSIKRGIITGAAIGSAYGIISSLKWVGEYGILSGAVSAAFGFGFGIVGAGIGTISGTIKDRIPIRASLGNLEKYRGSLQDYSFKHEKGVPEKKFIHRLYAGASLGPSFASDEFAPLVPAIGNKGMEKTGFGSKLTMGYRLTERLGVNFSVRTNQYSIVGTSQDTDFWSLDDFTIGPVISLPIAEKFRFDFLPSIGYTSAYLTFNNKEILTGKGMGVGVAGNLVYDFSKRWLMTAGIGYLTSNQKYDGNIKGKSSDLDLGFGLIYKFGKQSL
jgi:hypothetical protein